jgi:hypothetical protein
MSYAEFRDRFAEGIDPRFYTIEYLDWLLSSGQAKIWFADDAAVIAEIKTFPTGAKALDFLVVAGDVEQIVGLNPEIEEWGRMNGCAYGIIESRDGWQKIMKSHGYTPFQLSLVKEL